MPFIINGKQAGPGEIKDWGKDQIGPVAIIKFREIRGFGNAIGRNEIKQPQDNVQYKKNKTGYLYSFQVLKRITFTKLGAMVRRYIFKKVYIHQ